MAGLDDIERMIREKAAELGRAAADVARDLYNNLSREPTPAELAPLSRLKTEQLRALHYIYTGTTAGTTTRNNIIRKVHEAQLKNPKRSTLERNLKRLDREKLHYVAQKLSVPGHGEFMRPTSDSSGRIRQILDHYEVHYK